MEEFLTNLMSNSSLPVATAFILGLMTAISPCPLATNITAIGFIGKDVEDKRRVFLSYGMVKVMITTGCFCTQTPRSLIKWPMMV